MFPSEELSISYAHLALIVRALSIVSAVVKVLLTTTTRVVVPPAPPILADPTTPMPIAPIAGMPMAPPWPPGATAYEVL